MRKKVLILMFFVSIFPGLSEASVVETQNKRITINDELDQKGSPTKSIEYRVDGKYLPMEQAIPLMEKRMDPEEFVAWKAGMEYSEKNADQIANIKMDSDKRHAIIVQNPHYQYLEKKKKEKSDNATKNILASRNEVLDLLKMMNELKYKKSLLDNKSEEYRALSREVAVSRNKLRNIGYFSMDEKERAGLEIEARG